MVYDNRERKKVARTLRIKRYLRLCCSLWATGLGLRIFIELFVSDGWIHIPRNNWNLWFDFMLLFLFGIGSLGFNLQEMIKQQLEE